VKGKKPQLNIQLNDDEINYDSVKTNQQRGFS
jgi:hypothetical protein